MLPCSNCGGTGLIDPYTLCLICDGSGIANATAELEAEVVKLEAEISAEQSIPSQESVALNVPEATSNVAPVQAEAQQVINN